MRNYHHQTDGLNGCPHPGCYNDPWITLVEWREDSYGIGNCQSTIQSCSAMYPDPESCETNGCHHIPRNQ